MNSLKAQIMLRLCKHWYLFFCDYFSIRRKVVGMAVKISRVALTGYWRTSGSTWWETRQWDNYGKRFKILYKVSYSKFNVLNIHYCCCMHTYIHTYIHTYAGMHVCLYVFMHLYLNECYVCIYVRTNIHSYINTYLHDIATSLRI